MLTGEQLAGLIVAVFWAILVCSLGYALLKLARLLTETTKLMADLGDQAGPLLDDLTDTIGKASEQLGRTEIITRQMVGVSQNVSAVTTVVSSVVGGPLVKAAAFSYGVRRALGHSGPSQDHHRSRLPAPDSSARDSGERNPSGRNPSGREAGGGRAGGGRKDGGGRRTREAG